MLSTACPETPRSLNPPNNRHNLTLISISLAYPQAAGVSGFETRPSHSRCRGHLALSCAGPRLTFRNTRILAILANLGVERCNARDAVADFVRLNRLFLLLVAWGEKLIGDERAKVWPLHGEADRGALCCLKFRTSRFEPCRVALYNIAGSARALHLAGRHQQAD